MQTVIEAAVRPVHERWIAELKAIVEAANDATQLTQAFLDWQANLGAPEYTGTLGDVLVLSHLLGRSAVQDETGTDPAFATPEIGTVVLKEAQDFMRQKVSLPTKTWADVMHNGHDRSYVVAGADSVALVEDLRKAQDKAMTGGGGLEAFRKSFDEIVERTGWQYNGGRNWRTRVIYDTNLRTAFQAGRLKQLRENTDSRPYWLYVHGARGVVKEPREEHLGWDGKVWRHDDPVWDIIYPPSAWGCKCGVTSLSEAGLKREGKTAPDLPPDFKMKQVEDPVTGEMISIPEGVDLGWGYMPGDIWERGIVPREWQKPLAQDQPELPLPVSPPLSDLGRPYASPQLESGKPPEYYVERFLSRFGAKIGQGVMFRDKAGQAVVISENLFKSYKGIWKVTKYGRERDIERMAEAIFDPAEIWVDWAELEDGTRRLVRRYIRWDPEAAIYSAFEWSRTGWSGVTSFSARKKGPRRIANQNYLEKQRRGVLMYRRPK